MNQRISTNIIFIAIVVASIALGIYLFSRQASNIATLGSSVSFVVSEQVKFSDGLSVTLLEVKDPRCKPGLECIWEGELAPVFRIDSAGADAKEIILGTVRTKSVTENGYKFTLQDAAVSTATIVVTKEESTLAPNSKTIVKKIGEREGSFSIQKINASSVDGLWYQAYPVGSHKGVPKTLNIGDDIGYACEGVSERLTSIDFAGSTITFTKTVGPQPLGGCPI